AGLPFGIRASKSVAALFPRSCLSQDVHQLPHAACRRTCSTMLDGTTAYPENRSSFSRNHSPKKKPCRMARLFQLAISSLPLSERTRDATSVSGSPSCLARSTMPISLSSRFRRFISSASSKTI
ncbi:hypothetical protein M514_12572, partial [Trichuris suis]